MSIIHDALKKVQRGLAPKTDETAHSSSRPNTGSTYIYATPPVETLPADKQQTAEQ